MTTGSAGDSLVLTVGTNCVYAVLVLAAVYVHLGGSYIICHVDVRLESGGLLSTNSSSANALARITQTNFESLWVLVVIANVSTLLPLPFLSWLPAESATCNPCQQSTLMPLPQSRSDKHFARLGV